MQDYITHCKNRFEVPGQSDSVVFTIDDMRVESPVKHPHLMASNTKGPLTTSNEAPAPVIFPPSTSCPFLPN